MIQSHNEMRELDIRLHIPPTLCNGLFSHLAFGVRIRETSLDGIFHCRCGLFGKFLALAVFQRTVRGGDNGIDATGRLEPCKSFTFSGAVYSD